MKEGGYVTSIYKNTNGQFEELTYTNFIKVWLGSVEWDDYDSDGDLDILAVGATVPQTEYEPISKIYLKIVRTEVVKEIEIQ